MSGGAPATSGAALRDLAARLRAAGIESARLDARILLAHVLGVDGMAVFSHPERPLSGEEAARLAAVAERRLRREPISHIIGRREFWSLSFRVTADTLDPRPDTETVVEGVLAALPDRQGAYHILDLGTGSGCILLALLSELPRARGLGVDASPAALAVAEENARHLGLAHRASFRFGDWGRGIDGLFNVIVSNPPYIRDEDIAGLETEVAAYEPRSALAGGPDGLDCYRALAPDLARLLAPGGVAALEVGEGQAEAVADIMLAAGESQGGESRGLQAAGIRPDLSGIGRCVMVRRPGA